MKIFRTWTLGAAALLSAATLLWVVPASESHAAKPAAAKPAGVAGKVTFLKGAAQKADSEKGVYKALKKNDDVREGEFIKTAGDGRIELKLGDGSLVRLAPNSTFKLGLAKQNAEKEGEKGQSKLSAGKMWASVTKAVGGDSKFAVRTENAVAGVRGTTFRVNAEEDGSTVVKVYEGAVAVTNGPLVEKAKSGGTGPIDFKGRKEVKPPMEQVSVQEFEKIVGKMMATVVAKDGSISEPAEFTAANDAANEADKDWVAWNTEMDQNKDRPQ